MNIIKAFEHAYRQKAAKKWDYIYVAVDIHGTIFKPTYSSFYSHNDEYYPYAKEVLQMMSRRKDIKLILWSSTPSDILVKYWKNFYNNDNIIFNYINENPEVKDTNIASFKNKFYFNVGLDDKFGFEPETDWLDIKQMLKIMAITRD